MNNPCKTDPFMAVFGPKKTSKVAASIDDHLAEVELITEFSKLKLENFERITPGQAKKKYISEEAKELLEHTPIPQAILDTDGNINPAIYNATGIDAKEIIENEDNQVENDISMNKKITGLLEDTNHLDVKDRGYLLSSDSASESDSNSEVEGAYPSEDSDGCFEVNSDSVFSDDD